MDSDKVLTFPNFHRISCTLSGTFTTHLLRLRGPSEILLTMRRDPSSFILLCGYNYKLIHSNVNLFFFHSIVTTLFTPFMNKCSIEKATAIEYLQRKTLRPDNWHLIIYIQYSSTIQRSRQSPTHSVPSSNNSLSPCARSLNGPLTMPLDLSIWTSIGLPSNNCLGLKDDLT